MKFSHGQAPRNNGEAEDLLTNVISDLHKEKKLVGLAATVAVDGEVVASAVDGERKKGSGVRLAVENIADVLAPVGADELDYTVSVAGELFGSFSDMSLALDGPNLHSIGLDTSAPGLRSGTVLVESMSQATGFPFYSFDVSYSVHIPEPSSLVILGSGLLAIYAARRRRVIGK